MTDVTTTDDSRAGRGRWGLVAAAVVVAIGAGVWGASHRAPRPAVVHPASVPAVAPGAADCVHPEHPPTPPDGATASRDDMLRGHDAVQSFVNRLEGYQACRNGQIDHAGADISPAQKQAWLDAGNTAVDEAHAIADAFGAQLSVYKGKHPGG